MSFLVLPQHFVFNALVLLTNSQLFPSFPSNSLNCELFEVTDHTLYIFISLYFQTLAQCILINVNNVNWWSNVYVGVSRAFLFGLWPLPPTPPPFRPRLVVFRCSTGTHRRSALLGAQYEVDSPRIMVKACGTVLGLPIYNLWRLTHSWQRLQCWGLSPNGLIIHMVFSEGGKNVFCLRPLTCATFQTGNHFSEI